MLPARYGQSKQSDQTAAAAAAKQTIQADEGSGSGSKAINPRGSEAKIRVAWAAMQSIQADGVGCGEAINPSAVGGGAINHSGVGGPVSAAKQ